MTHTCHPADRRKRNLRRQLAAGIVQQRVYFNFITHYRSFRECQLPFLPSFSLHEFLSRVLLFPSPVRAFTRTRVEGRRKGREGRRKNHGEAISRKRPSVTCHSRDYTIIAFPFHHQTYEYEIWECTQFSRKCEFPPYSRIIIRTRWYRTFSEVSSLSSPLNGITKL